MTKTKQRTSTTILTSAPESMCILRLSALGDVCNCVPAVRAIQRKWPDCRITWIIGKAEAQLLAGLSGIEFVVYDKKSGIKGVLALRKQLANQRFDVLLQMQAALRASVVSLAVKAKVRLGFDQVRAIDHQHWFTNAKIPPHPKAHVLEGFLDFAHALGVEENTDLTWDIPFEPLNHQQLGITAPYMLISPCSSQRVRNFRNWSEAGYIELINHAYHQYGVQTVLSGGNTELEQQYGKAICQGSTANPVNLIGSTSLKQLFALVDGATCVVGPDSGPMHMGTATGTPALGLYASSNPDRTGPYLSRQWVVSTYPEQIQKHFNCSVDAVSWGQRVREPDVMDSIAPNAVIERFDALMAHLGIQAVDSNS